MRKIQVKRSFSCLLVIISFRCAALPRHGCQFQCRKGSTESPLYFSQCKRHNRRNNSGDYFIFIKYSFTIFDYYPCLTVFYHQQSASISNYKKEDKRDNHIFIPEVCTVHYRNSMFFDLWSSIYMSRHMYYPYSSQKC